MKHFRIFVGYDAREHEAYRVAAASAHRHASGPLAVHPLVLADLRRRGLYTRPISRKNGRLYDPVSDAPMATEFAISRFFLPYLAGRDGWALFTDCDVLFRADPLEITKLADETKAVMVVQHPAHGADGVPKMDGQVQTAYSRKNWSSVCLWNLSHPAHDRLSVQMLNDTPGRDLHRFCWLRDDEIGALPLGWNWLEGYSPELPAPGPQIAHLTRGGPWMRGWENVAFADEWLAEAGRIALARTGAF